MRGDDDLLGTLELIVLLSVVCLGTDAYGMPIRDEIHRRIGRNISFGAVYVTLQRLESKGLVESWMGEPTAERGGRVGSAQSYLLRARDLLNYALRIMNSLAGSPRDINEATAS